MKLVNFEAGERVDAPDANALSDVVQGEFTRIVSHLTMANAYQNVLQDSPISYEDSGNDANLAVDPLVALSFGYDYPITSQPAITQPYIIQVGMSSSGVINGGMFIGDSVETPSVDLGDLANQAVGTVAFLYGRVKYKAGESRNRARWRSDLNPPREEVYQAKTRRVPAFDAIVRLQSESAPLASDGWFKIAKITRTSATTNDLRRLRFEDQRLLLLDGGFVSQRSNNGLEFNESKQSINIEASHTLGQYGNSGITQVIANADVVIAQAWTRVDILPKKSESQLQDTLTSIFDAYASTLRGDSLTPIQGMMYGFDLIQRGTLGGAGVKFGLPRLENVGSFYLEIQRVLNQLQYGQDTFVGLDASELSQANVPSKRSHGWRTNHTQSSIASATNKYVIGFTTDSASNETFPENLFRTPASVPANMFMAFYIFKPLQRLSSKYSAHQAVVWSGHRASLNLDLTDKDFGGTANNKASSTLRHNGGLVVRGANFTGTDRVRSVQEMTNQSSLAGSTSSNNRKLYANNAVLRRYGQGTAFAWCESETDGNKSTLVINDLVITDLMPSFSLDEFFEQSSATGDITVSYSSFPSVVTEVASINHADGNLLTVSGGNITFKNCTFISFQNSTNEQSVTDSFPKILQRKGNISIQVSSERLGLNAPVRFESCRFLRSNKNAVDDSNPTAMVSVHSVSSESDVQSGMKEYVIFQDCMFTDFVAHRETVNDTPRLKAMSTGIDMISFDQKVSRYVRLENCHFSQQRVLHEVIVDNCQLTSLADLTHTLLLRHRVGFNGANFKKIISVNMPSSNSDFSSARHVSKSDTSITQDQLALQYFLLPTGTGIEASTNGKIVSMISTQREFQDPATNNFSNVIIKTTDGNNESLVATVLPSRTSYLDESGALSHVSVVKFEHTNLLQPQKSDQVSSLANNAGVALKAKSYTRFEDTPSPILSDRVKATTNGCQTAELYHTSPYSPNMVGVITARPTNGVFMHGARVPFTMNGNEERIISGDNPLMNTSLFFSEGIEKRGFCVEKPDGIGGFASANENNYHPWTGEAYEASVQPPAFINDIYKQDASGTEYSNSLENTMVVSKYRPISNDGAVLQASAVLLSTPQEQSSDPLAHKLAGVNKLNTEAITVHGCAVIEPQGGNDRFHMRAVYASSDVDYISMTTAPISDDTHLNNVKSIRGGLTGSYFSTNMHQNAERLVGFVVFSEQYQNASDHTQLITPYLGDSFSLALASYLGTAVKSIYSALGGTTGDPYASYLCESANSASLLGFDVNSINQLNACKAIKLELMPAKSINSHGFAYLVVATKVLQDGSIVSGLVQDTDRSNFNLSLFSNQAEFNLTSDQALQAEGFASAMGIEFHLGLKRKL